MLQDSLVDLVVSLGVPLDHLVLGLPSSAAIFTLVDPKANTPRSSTVDYPNFLPYPKVGHFFDSTHSSVTNWHTG